MQSGDGLLNKGDSFQVWGWAIQGLGASQVGRFDLPNIHLKYREGLSALDQEDALGVDSVPGQDQQQSLWLF